MSAHQPDPGVSGAILSILNDPIAALTLARQIDRENGGECITANLQAAAIAAIAGEPSNVKESINVFQTEEAR